MPKFNVHLIETISTAVTVEAETADAATEAAFDSPDMPGGITYGAFGQASVDEAGEWIAVSVSDENGDEVWSEPADYEKLVDAQATITRLQMELDEARRERNGMQHLAKRNRAAIERARFLAENGTVDFEDRAHVAVTDLLHALDGETPSPEETP